MPRARPQALRQGADESSDNDEFEDHYIYIDFSEALESGEIAGKKKGTEAGWSATDVVSVDSSSLLTNTLTCHVNGTTLTGQHTINLGTQAFFGVSDAAGDGDGDGDGEGGAPAGRGTTHTGGDLSSSAKPAAAAKSTKAKTEIDADYVEKEERAPGVAPAQVHVQVIALSLQKVVMSAASSQAAAGSVGGRHSNSNSSSSRSAVGKKRGRA